MRMVELGSVCEIKNGYAFKSSEFKKSGTPLIRISSFDNGAVYFDDKTVYVDSSYLKTKSGFKVEKGDVLIALSGATTGKYGIYTGDEPSLLNQRIGLLKSGASEQMNDKFFYYYLSVLKSEILRNAGGAAQPNISTKSISELKIPLPPLDQQKKIASILDAADNYRQKTKALIKKYDALTQSLFLELFGDPVRNPKGWESKSLISLTTQKPDNGFFAKKDKYGENGMPVVWLTDFIDKLYISEHNLRKAETLPKDDKYLLEYGDALFCRSSLNVEGIGKCSIAPREFSEPTIFECHIIRLRFNLGCIIPEYFRFLSDTKYFRNCVMRNAKTSTMTTISQDGISNIEIPLPNLSLQILFRERIYQLTAQKAQAQASLVQAEDLFNSLLQRAFKGELTN